MKLEIEVYDVYQDLYYLYNNKVTMFKVGAVKIASSYTGGAGHRNWGETSSSGGYPIEVYYAPVGCGSYPKDDQWVDSKKLFSTKEELLKSL
jgi:hypothetical protein